MKTLKLLEAHDTVLPDDWCRPLELETMSGGMSDTVSFTSAYSGRPENNVKWVRVKFIFGPCWYGRRVDEICDSSDEFSTPYEFVRGDLPLKHCLDHSHTSLETP